MKKIFACLLVLMATPAIAARPVYLEQKSPILRRTPASSTLTATEKQSRPSSTQNGFLELTPLVGSVSIGDKAAFTFGSLFAFKTLPEIPVFFEPALFVSYLPGDNNRSTALFHINGGFRYDFAIPQSPIVPFLRAGVGPTISSSSGVVVGRNLLSDSYFSQFYGGGLRILVSPLFTTRVDVGSTFQSGDLGLYAMAAFGANF